jgi:putative transposase
VIILPRAARVKLQDAIYHVMARSISEIDMFKEDIDKKKYLALVKKYQELYKFRVYGYCLMSNHLHFIIDANGSDISKVMHSINFSYAQYFNRTHNRRGHLFQDRFKSKIITDDKYLIVASAYVHNNPMDISNYKNCPEKYEFSSLSIYLGLRQDPYELVDNRFIKGLFGKSKKAAREKYKRFIFKCNDKNFKEEIEFENEETEYRSERKILVRDYRAETIIDFICNKMSISKRALSMKWSRKLVEAKALLIVLMRSLCNFRCSTICNILGNITQTRVSVLSSIGIELIMNDKRYLDFIDEFINYNSSNK